MKTLLSIAVCFLCLSCLGQTKLIAHRSHSGSNASFRTAIEGDMFDIGRSNFGIVGTYVEKIDTVALIRGNKIVVYRKTYNVYNGKQSKAYALRDTLTKANAAEFFTANSADSLKAVMHKKYKTSKTDNTLFIGFNKLFKQNKG